jgi:hypothetical protein
MSMNPRAAEMYHRRREKGLCVRCGQKAMPGTSQCELHQKGRNTYHRIRHHAKRLIERQEKQKKAKKRKAAPASRRARTSQKRTK